MGEISKSDNTDNVLVQEQEIAELKDFPGSVSALFRSLPEFIREKIFPQTDDGRFSDSSEKRERSLGEVVAGLDEKTREEFMARCLHSLFESGKFKERLDAVEHQELKKEIYRMLDVLWGNRKKSDDVELFNKVYYEKFFKEREPFVLAIRVKNDEIKKLNTGIARTIKQKRLTETKMGKLGALEKERELLLRELKFHDDENGNSNYDQLHFRDVASCQRKEGEWTKAVAVTSEYLAPDEFATMMAEQFGRTFYNEFSVVRNPEKKYFDRTPSAPEVARAKEITDKVNEAIEEWHKVHQNEESLKTKKEAKLEDRQAKLIDYLTDLMGSYQRGRQDGRPEEDMEYTVRQMEVTLNILGK
ncbi:MAG: hypothetical protein WC711_02295 [Candidatus Staskawiczbacteria bacterium]|jgi:hypothetical protein